MNASLNAQPRDTHGKGAARRLRREGRVPAVIYGHGDQTRSLSLDALELEKMLHGISVENTVVALSTGTGSPISVLIRDVQTHPVRATVEHVDFIQLHAGEAIKLQIPIRLIGTPVGVHEQGGLLDQAIHDLDIECLPRNIPDSAEVDVSKLSIGESVRVNDLQVPNVTILIDGELTVASVIAPRVVAVDEPETIGEDGVGGTVDHVLIRDDTVEPTE